MSPLTYKGVGAALTKVFPQHFQNDFEPKPRLFSDQPLFPYTRGVKQW